LHQVVGQRIKIPNTVNLLLVHIMNNTDKNVLEKTIGGYNLPIYTRAENGGRIAKVWWRAPFPEIYINGFRWAGDGLSMFKTNGYLHGLTIDLDNGEVVSAIVTTEKKESHGGNLAYFKSVNELALHEKPCDLEKIAEN